MILFLDDWKKYPDAIIDYKTSNKSALILASKLKQLGIKNNAFFLVLHDPSLQGVDPYSKTLTQNQMLRIGLECRINPWYYFREIGKAPALAGLDSSPIELNRANVSLWWSFFNHATYILTQPRQTGKSFSTDHLMTFLMNFYTNNTVINLLTKDDSLRVENVARLKAIYEELPLYLNFKTRQDSNNTEELSIKKFSNKYKTHVPQASPKKANNLGRGLTTPIIHVDEPPFQPNIEIAMDACIPAMGAAVDAAKRNGEPYGIIFTTTAGKKDDKDGKYVYNFVSAAATWTEVFYDTKNEQELKELVMKNSRKGVYRIYGSFSHTQLGKDDNWLREKLTAGDITPESANRDYFNIWTSGSQSSPLSVIHLERLTSNICYPDYTSISSIGGYALKWYIPENQIQSFMNSRKTIVGVDTSDGAGGDDISFIVVDVLSGATIAVGNFNETNLITFSQWLVSWLVMYQNSTMIIERKSSGVTIIDYLLLFLPEKQIDPFTRLFNWIVNDKLEHQERYEEAILPLHKRTDDLYVRCKKYFGFATSGSGETARTELYSKALQNAAKRCSDKVYDRQLTEQITSLVIRNGRVDHDIGGHDDLVIGWLLCHWFLTMAKNISHYSIDPNTVLEESKESNFSTNNLVDYEQQNIREKIKELFDQLASEENEFLCERIERQLRLLDSKIVLKDNEYFSVDATINQARESNKNKIYRKFEQQQQFNSLDYLKNKYKDNPNFIIV